MHHTCKGGASRTVWSTLPSRASPSVEGSSAIPCLSYNVGVEQAMLSAWADLLIVLCGRSGNQKFVIKNVLADFGYYQAMQRTLSTSRYLRVLQDTIPSRSMFVYKYFKDHLLSLAEQDLPLLLNKRILKDTLRGLAELHHENIVHTGQADSSLRPTSL